MNKLYQKDGPIVRLLEVFGRAVLRSAQDSCTRGVQKSVCAVAAVVEDKACRVDLNDTSGNTRLSVIWTCNDAVYALPEIERPGGIMCDFYKGKKEIDPFTVELMAEARQIAGSMDAIMTAQDTDPFSSHVDRIRNAHHFIIGGPSVEGMSDALEQTLRRDTMNVALTQLADRLPTAKPRP